MNYYIKFLLTFLFLSVSVFSQVSQQWVARHNSVNDYYDYPLDMVSDESGNIYITGYTKANSLNSLTDMITIKYNSSGNVQWGVAFNGSGNGDDFGKAICTDNSGNVFVAVNTRGASTGKDIIIIKYNPNGSQQWATVFSRDGDDSPMDIAVDAAGNCYVTGYSFNAVSKFDGCTLKLNSSGNIIWQKFYNNPNNRNDYLASLTVTANGVFVTGYRDLDPSTNDALSICYDVNGNQVWISAYNAGYGVYPDNIKVDGSGNAYVSGTILQANGFYDIFIMKIVAAGVFNWIKYYNGPDSKDDNESSLNVDSAGNTYITGTSFNISSTDGVALKYDTHGSQVWVKRYTGQNGSLNNGFYSGIIDNSGNLYTAGFFKSLTEGYNYITIKYNSSGTQIWSSVYNNTINDTDVAKVISIDQSGDLVVTGYSKGLNTGIDIATVKYSQLTGIQINNNIPNEYKLKQNYPNPFNPSTKIEFSLPAGGNVKLSIYDISGKEIVNLVNKYLNAGSYSVDFNASELSTGAYFYRLQAGSYSETLKMVLIK